MINSNLPFAIMYFRLGTLDKNRNHKRMPNRFKPAEIVPILLTIYAET